MKLVKPVVAVRMAPIHWGGGTLSSLGWNSQLSEKNQRHKPHNASHHVRIEQFEEQRAQSPSQSRSC